jgi:molybdopterin-binding protein
MRRLGGRNQLVGRVESVRSSGLMVEVVISIGEQQITSIITARLAREISKLVRLLRPSSSQQKS